MAEPASRDGGRASPDRQTTLEASLFEELAELHPDRLTTDELVLSLGGRWDQIVFADALAGLRRSGLARLNGDLVELTHAAVNAHELLTL